MRLILTRRIDLPEDVVFGILADVAAQRRWMVASSMRTSGQRNAEDRSDAGRTAVPDPVGADLVARTGFGPFRRVEPLQVCVLEPARRWRLRRTGPVGGWREFGVLPRERGCLAYWAEEWDLPRRAAGHLAWALGGWLVRLGISASLARLRRGLRAGTVIGAR